MRKIILAIAILAILITSCAPLQPKEVEPSYKTFKESNLGFSLEYPASWTKTKEEGDIVLNNEKVSLKIKIIRSKSEGGKYANLKEIVDAYKQTVKGTEIKDASSTIYGNNAHEYKFKEDGKITKTIIIEYKNHFLLLIFEYKENYSGRDIERIIEKLNFLTEITEVEKIEEKVKEKAPGCGDGICSDTEDCNTCKEDCGCNDKETCIEGICKSIACAKDSDCDDGNACTENKCYFAGNPNAYCGSTIIKTCKDNDGCCPNDCSANTDNDCEPECGNGICEEGEDHESCEEDCNLFEDGTVNLDEYDTTKWVFSFDIGTQEEKYSAKGDTSLRFVDGNLESPIGENVIKDKGPCDEIEELQYAPTTSYVESAEAIVGNCYYIETNNEKYAVIKVKDIDEGDDIRFEWIYRTDGGRTFD